MHRFFTLIFFPLAGCAAPATPRPATDVVVGRGGELWRLNVTSGGFQLPTSSGPESSAAQPAEAPSGDRLVNPSRPPAISTPGVEAPALPWRTIYLQSLAGGSGEVQLDLAPGQERLLLDAPEDS